MWHELRSIDPVYGENYKKGYIGFTFYDNSMISKGIAYFTSWETEGQIKVSHTFLVSGENERLDAQVGQALEFRNLKEYFDDPHCHVFFKEPKFLSPSIADDMIRYASKFKGTQYDTSLVLGMAFSRSLFGRLLSRATFGYSTKWVLAAAENRKKMMCSELVADVLQSLPEYKGVGVLKHPNFFITPQMLFEDKEIWKEWKKE